MRPRPVPTSTPLGGDRVGQRAEPGDQVVLIEHSDSRQRMVDRRRGVTLRQCPLSRHCVHRPRGGRTRPAVVSLRVVCAFHPQHEVPHIAPLRPVPTHVDRGQEPQPSQQAEHIRPARSWAVVAGHQVPDKTANCVIDHAALVDETDRFEHVLGHRHRPPSRHDHRAQVTLAVRGTGSERHRLHPARSPAPDRGGSLFGERQATLPPERLAALGDLGGGVGARPGQEVDGVGDHLASIHRQAGSEWSVYPPKVPPHLGK